MAANAIGPLSAALAYDLLGNYFFIFALFSALTFVAGILVWLAHPPKRTITPTKLSPK